MYKRLGLEWVSSLLGFLAILLISIHFVLFYRGNEIKYKIPWTRDHMEQGDDALR
ncbi:hypothetical protein F5Y19DRAFT_438444 [Xylariaceae sp. FL1651]|nr:hypothetical protein F5Y19DRAFT_438444 [Xylariaceae sp. FL1651]